MKMQSLKTIVLAGLFMTMFIPSAATAGETGDDVPQPGFSGMIFIGGAYSSGDLPLDDASENDNQTISSLGHSPESTSEVSFIIGGELNYLFETGTMVSILGDGNTGLNMEGGLGLGISQFAGDLGIFSLAGFYAEKDVWADPFVTGTARSKTDEKTIGVVVSWEDILASDFTMRYGYEDVDVDNDLSGKANNRLNRDGGVHHLGLEYALLSNGTHEISTRIEAEIGDMDGSAYEYKGGELGLNHVFNGNGWDLQTGLYLGRRDYDGTHPAFGKEREDTRYGIDASYTLYTPFGLENYFVTFFGGYDNVDANIGFYDKSVWCAGAGVGLKF